MPHRSNSCQLAFHAKSEAEKRSTFSPIQSSNGSNHRLVLHIVTDAARHLQRVKNPREEITVRHSHLVVDVGKGMGYAASSLGLKALQGPCTRNCIAAGVRYRDQYISTRSIRLLARKTSSPPQLVESSIRSFPDVANEEIGSLNSSSFENIKDGPKFLRTVVLLNALGELTLRQVYSSLWNKLSWSCLMQQPGHRHIALFQIKSKFLE